MTWSIDQVRQRDRTAVVPLMTEFKDQVMVINLREERIDRLRESDPLKHTPIRSICLSRRERAQSMDRAAIRELQQLLEELDPILSMSILLKDLCIWVRRDLQWRAVILWSQRITGSWLPDWKSRFYELLYRKYSLKPLIVSCAFLMRLHIL